MRVVVSRPARADLAAIHARIAADNPTRAASFLGELRLKCASLASMASTFPLAARYAALGVRRRLHAPYQIFYRIERERVVILRVLHGAMDLDDIDLEP